MELAEAIRRRAMVRSFDSERAVPDDAVDALASAAIRAPTAGFSQGIEFLVLRDPDERARFWSSTSASDPDDSSSTSGGNAWLRGMRTAPLLIVLLADEDRYRGRYAEPDKARADQDPDRWGAPFWFVDAGMAAYAMLLSAVDHGLGACFFGVPRDRLSAVRSAFGVPDGLHLPGVLAIGYPDPQRRGSAGSAGRGRRPRNGVVHMGMWRRSES